MAANQNYTSVKLPRSLANRITEVAPARGYRNVSEFVLEWTRRGLDEVEK